MNWTKTADKLPPLDTPVWLCNEGRMFIGERVDDCEGWTWMDCCGSQYYHKGEWIADATYAEAFSPTHWMPLPEPPEREGGE